MVLILWMGLVGYRAGLGSSYVIRLSFEPTYIPKIGQILEGLVTVLVGFIAIFGMLIVPREWNSLENSNIVMVDYPSSAKFLTPEEKQFIIQRRGNYRFALSTYSSCIIMILCCRIFAS